MLKRTRPLLSQSYAKTLNLPHSTFPPRPDVSLRPALLKQCTDDLYEWQAVNRPASGTFTLHDGPPYANGPLHIGHALNKVLKDVFNRFECSQGKRVHYRPGWDCHGLPIELKALQASGMGLGDSKSKNAPEVRRAARALASRAVEEQMAGFKSWGVMGDWKNAYKTMNADFEIKQLEVFREMVDKGLVYRQSKPVYWSPSSRTALAEAELEYDEKHVSRAAYVAFELVDVPKALQGSNQRGPVYVLIWTTTPWTLPANKAIAFHNDLDYTLFGYDDRQFIVATSRLEDVLKAKKMTTTDAEVALKGFKGTDLRGATYRNLFQTRSPPQPLIHTNFVSGDSGTGLVHSAPGHGFDDYNACKALEIEPFAPVDDTGCFTEAARTEDPAALQGVPVLEGGSQRVLDLLGEMENAGHSPVWAQHDYLHKYPIDWRTKRPLIIRATAQWFANVDQIKSQALRALDSVEFMPETGKSRLRNFILGRSHWCISRQRAWGVPIPALFRISPDGKEEAVMTSKSVSHIISVIKERSIDAWWTDPEDDPQWVAPGLPSATYIRGKDTMDVWFDSGTTWTQLPEAPRSEPAADVYMEGTDQHRGWFQSSLLTRIAYLAMVGNSDPPQAPFKRLITHGFILDGNGRKMSKSLGNVVSPVEIMEGTLLPPKKMKKKQKHHSQQGRDSFDAMGPDALRLWAASNDYTSDVPLGIPILSAINTTLHKYRVTLKWLLGVLSDYSITSPSVQSKAQAQAQPSTPSVTPDLSDQLALNALHQITSQVHAYYTAYEPYKALTALSRYATNSLSASYFETAKDTLYTCPNSDRTRVQAVCYEILRHLLAMLAPVTPLVVQEALHYAEPGLQECLEQRCHHPFRDVWRPPTPEDHQPVSTLDSASLSTQNKATLTHAIRTSVRLAQEQIRASTPGSIGSGLDCHVKFVLPTPLPPSVEDFLQAAVKTGNLTRALVVSSLSVERVDEPILDPELLAEEAGEVWQDSRRFETTLKLDGDVGERDGEIGKDVQVVGVVVVLPPRGGKCPRCWRFVLDRSAAEEDHRVGPGEEVGPSGRSGEDGEVCSRCVEALSEQRQRHEAVDL